MKSMFTLKHTVPLLILIGSICSTLTGSAQPIIWGEDLPGLSIENSNTLEIGEENGEAPIYNEDGVLLNPGTATLNSSKPNQSASFKVLNTIPNGFGDDFEDGSFIDTWSNNLGSATPSISSVDPGEGNFSLQITGSNNNFSNFLSNTIPDSQPTEISFRLKASQSGASLNYVILGDFPSGFSVNGTILFLYWQATANSWRIVNGSNTQNLTSQSTLNAWTFFELKDIDWVNRHFDFYVDGNLVLSDYAFRGNPSVLNTILLKNFSGGSGVVGNWDDIKIFIPVDADVSVLNEVSCAGESDGSLVVNTTGISNPVSYMWNNGSTDMTQNGLPAGDYIVTVTGGAGEMIIASSTLADPLPVVASTTLTMELSCFGLDDGMVVASASGGTGVYDFLWNTGSTDPELSGLDAGDYIVTVTDENGCFDIASSTLTAIDPIVASSTISMDLSCSDSSDGIIMASATGGTGMFDFLWNTGSTTSTISGLDAGDYIVTVTDENGCFEVASSTLSAVDPIVASSTISMALSCSDSSDGIIMASATGGTGLFDFLWNTGSTTSTISGLDAGNYIVTVTDENGCFDVASSTIDPVTPIEVSIMIDMGSECSNSSDGALSAAASGGTGMYEYLWSNASTNASISGLSPGNYSVTVSDANDCSATDMITLSFSDNTAPTAQCQNITLQLDSNGSASLMASDLDGGSSDNCGSVSFTVDQSNFDCTNLGMNSVTLTVSDDSGNSSTCSAMVTVIDILSPNILTCTADVNQNNDAGLCGANVTISVPVIGVFANDNCLISSITNDFTGTADASGFYPVGTTTVSWTVFDLAGNTASCSFDVTITDNEVPEITCPSDQTLNNDPGQCGAIAMFTVSGSDNCLGTTMNQTAGLSSGSVFPVGTTTNVFEITDAAGLSSSCSFDITVLDVEAPTTDNCPGNVMSNTAPGLCGSFVSWVVPIGADNCAVTNQQSSHQPGDFFDVGTTTVSYTWMDAAGNVGSCSFDVIITDTEGPVFTGCPADISVNNAQTQCGNVVSWLPPTATDNCGSVVTTSTHQPDDFFPVGTTTVVYTSVDDFGNVSTCSFDITVNDINPPFIFSCGPAQFFLTDPGSCVADVVDQIIPPVVVENCTPLTYTYDPAGPYPIGTTPVTVTVTDAGGNTDDCLFFVIVTADFALDFQSCPGDQTFQDVSGNCGSPVFFTEPTFDTGCNIFLIGQTHQPGDFFPLGSTEVTYTIINQFGVQADCTFDVILEDSEAPEITASAGTPPAGSVLTVFADPGNCDTNVDWEEPIATDDCGLDSFDSNIQPNTALPVGITTVTYQAIDIGGNISSYSFDVEVLPNPAGPDCNGFVGVRVRVFLQGSFNGLDMDDDLRDGGFIPLNTPYGGPEQVDQSVLNVNDQVVDWVEVSLRNDPVPGLLTQGEDVVAIRSGLLLRDGRIVDVDGFSVLAFEGIAPGNYYIAVRHRNHLGLSTETPVLVSVATPLVDLSDPVTATYGGSFDGEVVNGFRTMVTGDVDGDGVISSSDRNMVWNSRNTGGYIDEDVNMDIVSTAADRTIVSNNSFRIEVLP